MLSYNNGNFLINFGYNLKDSYRKSKDGKLSEAELIPDNIYFSLFEKNFPYMNFDKVKMLLDTKPWVVIFNKSIWNNTLSKIIDLEFCDKVLGCPKPHYYYVPEELPY